MHSTYESDEEPMPGVYKKFEQMTAQQVLSQSVSGSAEVHVQPGAGTHEPKFRNYWLTAAWMFLAYQGLALGVLIFNMVTGHDSYLWLAHTVSTAVVVAGMGIMAWIYRFILYPQPAYYSTTPPQQPTNTLPVVSQFRGESQHGVAA